MKPSTSLARSLLFVCAAALAACSHSPSVTAPDAAKTTPDASPAGADASLTGLDAATLAPEDAGAAADASTNEDASVQGFDGSVRTLIERPLFGDTHPQNLFIDPTFSVRNGGLGNWMTVTDDPSQYSPTFSAALLSDSPAGIAMATARLADAKASTGNFQLDAVAQVPGGPGPYNLRVWISTLDATASASLTGVTVGVLLSLNGANVIQVSEDPAKAQVIAGRTWHLYSGEIDQALDIGGFILFDFAASTNTWLLQAPEFIPVALAPSPQPDMHLRRPAAAPRPSTPHERSLVERYRQQPKISVPAGHPAVRDLPANRLRR